jgi:hypothetical protein
VKLFSLAPNSYMHVSVSDCHHRSAYFAAAVGILYINRSQIQECGNWEGGRAVSFLGINKLDLVFSGRPSIFQVNFQLERVQCRFSVTLTQISRTEENKNVPVRILFLDAIIKDCFTLFSVVFCVFANLPWGFQSCLKFEKSFFYNNYRKSKTYVVFICITVSRKFGLDLVKCCLQLYLNGVKCIKSGSKTKETSANLSQNSKQLRVWLFFSFRSKSLYVGIHSITFFYLL